jgi:hypothetical protein
MTYEVFKRKAYKRVDGRYVPHPDARRTVLRRGIPTIDEAREFCSKGPANVALEAGREYRGLHFYEFTKE